MTQGSGSGAEHGLRPSSHKDEPWKRFALALTGQVGSTEEPGSKTPSLSKSGAMMGGEGTRNDKSQLC